MIKITSVSLSGKLGYNATLPLADGVTVLSGDNASGKTLLATTIPDVLYPQRALEKGVMKSVTWEDQGSVCSVIAQNTANKSVWRCTVDGDAQMHRTISSAKEWVRRRLPLTYSGFTIINFLAPLRSGTMLSGNPAARMALLSEIVQITIFDEWRKALNSMYNKERVTIEVRTRLESELDKLQAPQSVYIPRIDSKIAKLQSSKTRLRTQAEDLLEQLDTAERPLAHMPDSDLATYITKLQNDIAAWEAYDEYEAAPKPIPVDMNDVRIAEHLEKWADKYPFFADLMQSKLSLLKDPKSLLRRKRELEDSITAVKTSLAHLEGAHSDNACPTCSQTINKKDLVKTLRKLLADHEKALKPIAKSVPAIEAGRALAELSTTLSRLYKYPPLKLSKARAIYAKRDELLDAADHNDKCDPDLRVVRKPDVARPSKAKLEAALDERALRKRGFVLDTKTASAQYEKLVNSHNMLAYYLRALTHQRDRQQEHDYARQRRASIQRELEQLPVSEDAELMMELLKALDNKNARNRYIKLFGDSLVDWLNELAPRYYSYKVEFAWVNGSIVANRKGYADDVSTLSGHESKVFMLLNAVSTQSCLPPSQRIGTLILDEIEANSQQENREALAEIIPQLLDYYSNILVVSPQKFADFPVHGRRYHVTPKKTLTRVE